MKELAAYLADEKITFSHIFNPARGLQRFMIPQTTPEQFAEIQTICKENKLTFAIERALIVDKTFPVVQPKIKK